MAEDDIVLILYDQLFDNGFLKKLYICIYTLKLRYSIKCYI